MNQGWNWTTTYTSDSLKNKIEHKLPIIYPRPHEYLPWINSELIIIYIKMDLILFLIFNHVTCYCVSKWRAAIWDLTLTLVNIIPVSWTSRLKGSIFNYHWKLWIFIQLLWNNSTRRIIFIFFFERPLMSPKNIK